MPPASRIGHVHLTVRDPDAHNKLWALLGAEVTRAGSLELLKFPGIFVILTKGEPTDGIRGFHGEPLWPDGEERR